MNLVSFVFVRYQLDDVKIAFVSFCTRSLLNGSFCFCFWEFLFLGHSFSFGYLWGQRERGGKRFTPLPIRSRSVELPSRLIT